MDAGESEPTPMRNRTTVERKSERELVVTRTFNGPARLVFEAWTTPELFRQWWVPKSMGMSLLSCEMDVRVGGTYRLEFAHGDSLAAFFGTYKEVAPHSRLVWTNEESDEGSVTTVTFAEKGGRHCWSCTSFIPRRKLSTPPAPGHRMRWESPSSNWTSFSSPWARAWDGHEVVGDACQGEIEGWKSSLARHYPQGLDSSWRCARPAQTVTPLGRPERRGVVAVRWAGGSARRCPAGDAPRWTSEPGRHGVPSIGSR